MSEKLPDLIDPLLLAERRAELSGEIKLASLERLSPLLINTEGVVNINVVFAKEGKRPIVSGNLKTSLTLTCQACLQALSWPIDINFKLGVVASLEEADGLEIDCEPLIFDGNKVSLNALMEDEILLALPDYPKHGEDCIKRIGFETKDDRIKIEKAKAENPFSVLAKLKKTGE